MSRQWPEPVERVVRCLREAGAVARVEEFAETTATAEDAAAALGCDLAQIVKTLVFDCDGAAVAALVPGDRRADPRKVARSAGATKASIVGAARVREITGFPAGAVAPFPLPNVRRVLADETLLAHPIVWVGAGSPNHLAGLSPQELLRVADAEAVDVAAGG